MRVTIGQINTTNGDYAGNTARILRAIEQARRDRTEMVVLPEAAIQGYASQDWFLDRDIMRGANAALETIINATENLTAIVGTVRPTETGNSRPLYNCAAVIHDRKLLGFADKTLLPDYDVFDEPRYFASARERRLFRIGAAASGMSVGVTVCEDFWNDVTFWGKRFYERDPADDLIAMGANVLVGVNAALYRRGKTGERCAMVTHRARSAGLPVVFVNLVGGNDNLVFDGASIIADCAGNIILQAPAFEEFYGTVDLDCGVRDDRCLAAEEIESVRQALVLGIRDYAHKNDFTRAVLGLSGGIDSAVAATLACEALGSANVLGVMMPSQHSSRGSIEDSIKLGRQLGLELREHPIRNVYESLAVELKLTTSADAYAARAAENLQARLRGSILMTISNAERRLLLATGNKSELALGYCTLYGDTCGGLAALGDVLKTDVYALARHYNREREIIPPQIINKRPSAELAPDQYDDQTLPPYDQLDPVIKLYFEQNATPEEIVAAGHDAQMVYDVLNKIESSANEYKRRQLPPSLILSRNAIGAGRRRPITHRYTRTRPTN